MITDFTPNATQIVIISVPAVQVFTRPSGGGGGGGGGGSGGGANTETVPFVGAGVVQYPNADRVGFGVFGG
jgi:hypothetical protein